MESKMSENARPHSPSPAHSPSEASKSQPFLPGLKVPWEKFYRSQTERLSRIAVGMRVPSDRIADVLQEVWLAVLKKHDDFAKEDVAQLLPSWLAGVTRHKSRDVLRRLRRRREESLEYLPAEPMDRKTKEAAELAKGKERAENLASKLEVLQKQQPLNCYLVCQHLMEGRSIGELVDEIGLSANSISCRIRRTLKRLRCWLRE